MMFETILILGQGTPGQGGLGGTFIMVGLMFLVFYLLVWRPEAKKQESHSTFIKNLKVGDEIVTAGGVVGKIVVVDDNVLTIEASRGTKIRVIKQQVQSTLKQALAKNAQASDTAKNDDTKNNSTDEEDENATKKESSL